MASPRTLPPAGGGPPNPAHLPLFTVLSAYADALDALPLDLTRSFSDLRELDAVLGTHLSSLTSRLYALASALSDPELTPAQRLLALKECAEEARAYKEGGEDKIRVAVNTAETIASHTDFIDRLANGILGSTIPELAPALRPSSGRFLHHSRVPYDPQRDRYMVDTVTEEDLPESYNSVEHAIATLKAQAAANGETLGSGSSKSNNALASRFNLNLQAGGAGSSFGMLGPSFHTHHGAGAAAAAVAAAAVLNGPSASSSSSGPASGAASGGSAGGGGGYSASAGADRGAHASGSGLHSGSGHDRGGSSSAAHDRHSSTYASHHSSSHRSSAGGSHSHHSHTAAQSSHAERHGGGHHSHTSAQHSGSGGSHSRSSHHHQHSSSSHSHRDSQHGAYGTESGHASSSRSHSSHHAHAHSGAGGHHGSGASYSATGTRESNSKSSIGGNGGGTSSSRLGGATSSLGTATAATTTATGASAGAGAGEDQEDQTRYCYCQQVSYGEMIACDSRDCPYEWFHLVCVNLTEAPPEGSKWYCDHCLEKRAKKKGKSGARGAR